MPRKAHIYFALAIFMAMGFAPSAKGEDRFVLRFFAFGPQLGGANLTWIEDTVLYNPGPNPATIKLLGVSNGGVAADVPRQFSMAPRETALLEAGPSWQPTPFAQLWVVHLDVPAGVVMASRGAMGEVTSPPGPVFVLPDFGRFPLPIFKALVPASKPQVHLSADLGFVPSHFNVAIYNAGAAAANAVIEIRNACDGSTISSRTVQIEPNTVVQYANLSSDSEACPVLGERAFVVVTVDQPSLSFVTSVANALPASVGIGEDMSQ
jgi:hypothetical protein